MASKYPQDKKNIYSHITEGSEDNHQIDETDLNEMIQIELGDVYTSIDLLSQYPEVELDLLSKDDPIYKAFEKVKLAVSLLYDTDNYSTITDHIAKQYRPDVITPGTVGAFLFGCSQSYYGDITNRYCSPLCIQNVLPNKSDYPISCCPYRVFILDTEGQLKPSVLESDDSNNRAYIYSNDKFKGFTPNNIAYLKSQAIAFAQVFDTSESKHTMVVPMTPVNKLPMVGAFNSTIDQMNNQSNINSTNEVSRPSATGNTNNNNNLNNNIAGPNSNINPTPKQNSVINPSFESTPTGSKSSFWMWLLLILIIVLLGIVIWWFIQKRNRQSVTTSMY